MPRQIIPTSAPGSVDDWAVTGAATSWEAVLRGSSDASYIDAFAAGDTTVVYCGSGSHPLDGKVTAVTIHYRMKSQVAASGAIVDLILAHGALSTTAGSIPLPTDAWVDGELRVRSDWISGLRFTSADLVDLSLGVSINVPPIAGSVLVSQLWLEVENIDIYTYYDPFSGVLPDIIVGPLNWITAGVEPSVITPNGYLNIADLTYADARSYRYNTGLDRLTEEFVTEIETRQIITTIDVLPTNWTGVIIMHEDHSKRIGLTATKIAGVQYLGLMKFPAATYTNPADFIALVPYDFVGMDIHYRLKIDRDSNPGSRGKVQVFLNYSDTPLFDVYYIDCSDDLGITPENYMFGSEEKTSICDRYVDYFSWKNYKKYGYMFASWEELDLEGNAVNTNNTDLDIVRPMYIDPPGITAGQSTYCCDLDVANSPYHCQITQKYLLRGLPVSYKIFLDYKMLLPAVTSELVVQRCSDLWYWDNTLHIWTPMPASMLVPNAITRTRAQFVDSLSLLAPESILVRVRNTLVPQPPHRTLIYKVYLGEE